MRLTATLLLLLGLGSCGMFGAAPSPAYVVGAPYQAGGVWRYPRETFDYDQTGLASVAADRSGLTANGEAFDQAALAAGHPTLQLPALVRITNLENGRQVVVRVNDRGPARPSRLVELTRRTVQLLAAADPRAMRVRVQLVEAESRQLASDTQAAGPSRPVAVAVAAPRGSVQSENLAPPRGASASGGPRQAAALPSVPARTVAAAAPIPQRLPELVTQVAARPGILAIDCGSFGRPEYAEIMRARLAGLGAAVTSSHDAPRDRSIQVRISGLADTAQADAMLVRALAAGVTDARIVVE